MDETEPNTTPLPQTVESTEILMDFPNAMREVINNQRVTRKEWNNPTIFGYLLNGHLSLHKDDKDFDWIVNDGDLLATDWIIVA